DGSGQDTALSVPFRASTYTGWLQPSRVSVSTSPKLSRAMQYRGVAQEIATRLAFGSVVATCQGPRPEEARTSPALSVAKQVPGAGQEIPVIAAWRPRSTWTGLAAVQRPARPAGGAAGWALAEAEGPGVGWAPPGAGLAAPAVVPAGA